MAAGNTLNEALVQGLSEIFERYATRTILFEGLTPPRIPRDYLQQFHPEIASMVQLIEANPRYRVSVLDASLGKDLPCAGCIIHDQQALTFGVSFAAHPNRQFALERCFSEAMQGWTVETFSEVTFAPFTRSSWSNIRNIYKTSKGRYPASLLGSELFIQDVSILVFPAVYIYAPGISELTPMDMLYLQERASFIEAQRLFTQLTDFTPQKAERLLSIVRTKSKHLLENDINSLTCTLFSDCVPDATDSVDFLAAVCSYYLGKDREACLIFEAERFSGCRWRVDMLQCRIDGIVKDILLQANTSFTERRLRDDQNCPVRRRAKNP